MFADVVPDSKVTLFVAFANEFPQLVVPTPLLAYLVSSEVVEVLIRVFLSLHHTILVQVVKVWACCITS